MRTDPERIFNRLIAENPSVYPKITEIAKLDKELDKMVNSRIHPMMFEDKIHRIQSLTYQVSYMASEISGEDEEHLSNWLSHNVQSLFMYQHRVLDVLDKKKLANDPNYRKEVIANISPTNPAPEVYVPNPGDSLNILAIRFVFFAIRLVFIAAVVYAAYQLFN